ncbi:MAG: endonuclease/exonuclease/phosphatase family protein [Chlamydiae bacterium]|nr:endonuclease/exonuclease/phosphatase family protein [Chlamydiota bacterium]
MHNWYQRIVQRLMPNHYGQTTSKTTEVASRVLLAFAIVPMTILSPLAFLGIGFRYVANFFRPAPYVYFKTDVLEKETTKFSIFSLNTCFISGGWPLTEGGVAPWKDRIDKIASLILRQNADIVALQEVFDLQAGFKLYKELKNNYTHFYLNIGPNKQVGVCSGLFVASKIKIVHPQFFPFERAKTFKASFMNKGFFSFDLVSQKKHLASLFVTHMHHSENDLRPALEDVEMREKQIEKIILAMEKKKEGPKVLVGDLNMDTKEAEANLSAHFVNFTKEPTAATEFLKRYIKSGKKIPGGFTLDYALLQKEEDGSCKYKIKTHVVETFSFTNPKKALSDHYGLLTVVG